MEKEQTYREGEIKIQWITQRDYRAMQKKTKDHLEMRCQMIEILMRKKQNLKYTGGN